MTVRALLIEVDYQTGKRAGDVDPRDPNLQSYGWQSLPNEDGGDVEIRVVEDDRDLARYEDIPGVRVLEGEDAINDAIDRFIPPKYNADADDLSAWYDRTGRSPGEFPSKGTARMKALREAGAPVERHDPPKVGDVGNAGRSFGSVVGKGRGIPDK